MAACLPAEAQPLPVEAPSGGSSSDSLSTYIVAALRANPEVMARWHAYEAAIEGICPAGALADPELSLNFFPKPMAQVNGKQVLSVSVMQMFPWFGALKAAKNEKAWQAETQWQSCREGGIEIAYEVARQWYGMLVTREKLSATRRHTALLEEIRQTALHRYKTAGGSDRGSRLSDQYRLQAEQLKLAEQTESLEALLSRQRGQFNLLLHREPQSPLVLPDSIVLCEKPALSWQDIEQLSPSLLSQKANAGQYEAQGEKARLMGMPMIGIGVQYMLNTERNDAMIMPGMNGMDMWMGMIKLSIPVYRGKVKAQRRSAELLRQTADETYLATIDKLRSQLLSIDQRADDIERKMRLYMRDIDILDRSLQLMTTEYAAGITTLSDILQTQREQLDYVFSLAEARAQHNLIVAEYEKIASTTITNQR